MKNLLQKWHSIMKNKTISLSGSSVTIILTINSVTIIIGEKLIAARTGQIFFNPPCHLN